MKTQATKMFHLLDKKLQIYLTSFIDNKNFRLVSNEACDAFDESVIDYPNKINTMNGSISVYHLYKKGFVFLIVILFILS